MNTKHTPGPWTVDPEGEVAVSIEGADGSVVCDVHGASNDPLGAANARLIAAAPDLLAALEEIVREPGRAEFLAERALARAKGAA